MIAPAVALAAACCASASYLGVGAGHAVCRGVAPEADGPAEGRVPVAALTAAAALLGLALGWHGAGALDVAVAALVLAALSATWTTDVTRGLVFDAFVLSPLAAVVVLGAARQEWGAPVAAALVALPFALAALFSRGRGMGWGDAELAALGGAIMGVETAALLFAAASAVAFGTAAARRARGPIAFAPYLVAAIAAGIALGGRA